MSAPASRAAARLALILCAVAAGAPPLQPVVAGEPAVAYDIVYVRQPRFGDQTNTTWPEVFFPAAADPGADLMLLHPDGSEELLFTGGNGVVTDPFVSFDGRSVYFAYFHDMRPQALNAQRRNLPYDGADIFRLNLDTRQVTQLTHGEFSPNTGAGHWDESNPVDPPPQYNRLGYGILNLGPCPLPGGRIAFVSNRNGFEPPRDFTGPTFQLFVMDADGANVTCIAPMNIGSALHPTILRDGRIMFSSYESQGLRDIRLWGVWYIYPDGRQWGPLLSAFRDGQAFHFMTQMGNGDLVIEDYYNLNNNGFGALYRFPLNPPAGQAHFHPAFLAQNPDIERTIGQGLLYPFRMPFTPRGMYSITPMTHADDEAAPLGPNGIRVGKFTHPSAAPDNNLLVCWSPGPCNDLDRPVQTPRYDGGLYLAPGGAPVWSPSDLVLIRNDPAYNEAWPRAVVPYRDVHGVDEPAALPWLPNDGTQHALLPAGTPYGLVGTSSFYKRESFPGFVSPWSNTFEGLDAFNTSENGQSSNWTTQGSDAGKYANADIWAVRILAMEPHTHRSYGPHNGIQFDNHANERLRILGEIPLRKTDAAGQPVLDQEGNPDTSFLAKLPADTPFTFQTLDRRGLVLNMAQTWHQVRPGELRTDCGGCHAHSQQPLHFYTTAAARAGYSVYDLNAVTPLLTEDAGGQPAVRIENTPVVNVEFYRDIRPLLMRSCAPCHTHANPTPPGNLVLDDHALYSGLPGDYKRLADDRAAQWGHPPVISNGTWRQTNASRYVRMFQSRRSLLIWKIFGERLDGWTNADHPTESTPGVAASLPPGADPNEADLDFTGTAMPPPGSGAPPLSADEKRLFARWIDLGCPINTAAGSSSAAYGWFLDDLRPTLAVSSPRPGRNEPPLERIRIGVADAYSGIAPGSISVASSIALAGRPAGAELADLLQPLGDGRYDLPLSPPLTLIGDATLHVAVRDVQGNITRVAQRFSVTPFLRRGDTNCDSLINFHDIDPFLLALFEPAAYAANFPACDLSSADLNRDGRVTFFDIDPFVACLFSGQCP